MEVLVCFVAFCLSPSLILETCLYESAYNGEIAFYVHQCEKMMKKFVEKVKKEEDGLLSPTINQYIESVDITLNLAVKMERELLYEDMYSDEEAEDIEEGNPDEIESNDSDLDDKDGVSERHDAPDYADYALLSFVEEI